jgi:hypothetical protein
MSRVVHLQTTVQTVFGVLDGDGNAVPQQPVVASVPTFSNESFIEAFEAIAAKRDEATAALEGNPDPAGTD